LLATAVPEEWNAMAGDLPSSLAYHLNPVADHPSLWDFTHQRIRPLTSDQKAAVRAVLHWLYRRDFLKGIELRDWEKALFAYWGWPEGSPGLAGHHRWPRAAEAEGGEGLTGGTREEGTAATMGGISGPLPPVISGAMLSEDGRWMVDGGNCQFIQWLTANRLVRLDQREGVWTQLYQDPMDGSYWELAYPHSEMWGGGPPVLTRLSVEQVQTLYDREIT
jgi:hypothetical protein